MTVTELREQLQRLEADGKGNLPIAVNVASIDGSEAELQAAGPMAEVVVYGSRISDIYETTFKRGQLVVVIE